MNENPYLQQCALHPREQAFADLEIAIQMAHEDDDRIQMYEVFYHMKDISGHIYDEEILEFLEDTRVSKINEWHKRPEDFIRDFNMS
jgi:hypothetical protein